MNHQACAINATLQLVKEHKIQLHFICGGHWNISIKVCTYLTIVSPHTTLPMFCWKSVSLFHRNPWQCDPPPPPPPPPQVPKEKGREPKGELISLSDVISQDKIDLSPSFKNTFCRLTTSRILKIKDFGFDKSLHFACAKPPVNLGQF